MVMNGNVPCHLQQCKCPDQDLWAPLYTLLYRIDFKCVKLDRAGFKGSNLWPVNIARSVYKFRLLPRAPPKSSPLSRLASAEISCHSLSAIMSGRYMAQHACTSCTRLSSVEKTSLHCNLHSSCCSATCCLASLGPAIVIHVAACLIHLQCFCCSSSALPVCAS